MRLDNYDYIKGTDGDFKTITFKDDSEYTINFTIHENGDNYMCVDDGVSIADVKKAIEMIESGKVCIDL